jgi:hypothetical protein
MTRRLPIAYNVFLEPTSVSLVAEAILVVSTTPIHPEYSLTTILLRPKLQYSTVLSDSSLFINWEARARLVNSVAK